MRTITLCFDKANRTYGLLLTVYLFNNKAV